MKMELNNVKKGIFKLFSLFFVFLLSFGVLAVGCSDDVELLAGEEYIVDMEYVDNFKIAVLADLHIGSASNCVEVFDKVKKSISQLKPNLIVLTGDNVWRMNNRSVVEDFVSQMESMNIPWAPVFGNHDIETGVSKNEFANLFYSAENCMFMPGKKDITGVGNYVISLKKGEENVYNLFLIDSNRRRFYFGEGWGYGYDYIYTDQIDWYRETVGELSLKYGYKADSMMFFHIPLPEFVNAREYLKDNPSAGYGVFNEKVCCPNINTRMFDCIKELNCTRAIFCGHDHTNNCDINYEGVRFNYVLKSSKGAYYDDSLYGITTVEITPSKQLIIKQNAF